MTHTHDDIVALENRIRAMHDALDTAAGRAATDGLAPAADAEELITIIHRPGWTTIAELRLVNALVDSITAHAHTVAGMRAALLAASREIGT